MIKVFDESWLRGINCPRSKYYDSGKFGRLFPSLPPFAKDTEKVRLALLELGKKANNPDNPAIMDQPGNNPDNPAILAGFTFFGQFIDHDITFDPTSSLERQNDPEAIENFRTPVLELDSVYGGGPSVNPHLYDNKQGGIKFLIDADSPNDVPRNSQNTALTSDPRNDENVIISQLHLAFIKFHNAVVEHVKADGITGPNLVFSEAQRLVRWHYQWIVLHEFLPHIVGKDLVANILKEGRKFYCWRKEPFIPVEFAVAAYRFGHSQVRPGYKVNDGFAAPIFDKGQNGIPDPNDLRGGIRAPRRFVQWSNFFNTGTGTPQPGKRIDTTLSSPLFDLPFVPTPSSLAQRNLLRELAFGLPSGQDVAKAMSIEPLHHSDLSDVSELGFDRKTPLWFYILREAQLKGNGGQRLGPVGGRIVAEVLIGLLQGDKMSFLSQNPRWVPTLPGKEKGNFTMVDLLKFAGVA